MAENKQLYDITIYTFTRSLKNSMFEVYQLCDGHDLVLLQKHWLLPNELHLLSEVHADTLLMVHLP